MALAMLGLTGNALAVEDAGWQTPMADLDRMVGFWEVTTFARDVDGEWQAGHITLSNIGPEPGGTVLREDALVVDPRNRFQLIGYWSWDQLEDTYRVALMDKRLGITDVYEGTDTEDGLILTEESRSEVLFGRKSGDSAIRLRQEFQPVPLRPRLS
jgi:hypothetical protein